MCRYTTVLAYEPVQDRWEEDGEMALDRRRHLVVEVPAEEFCAPYGYWSGGGGGDGDGAGSVAVAAGAVVLVAVNVLSAVVYY